MTLLNGCCLLVPLERVELPLERVVVLVLPEERLVAAAAGAAHLRSWCCRKSGWKVPEERVTCWLLPEERVLELERLLEELLELPVERVVVEPPPERDWASISGAVSMDSAITNEAA